MCKTRNERSPENEFRDGNAKPIGGYKHKHKGRVQAVDGYESGDDYAQQANLGGRGRFLTGVVGSCRHRITATGPQRDDVVIWTSNLGVRVMRGLPSSASRSQPVDYSRTPHTHSAECTVTRLLRLGNRIYRPHVRSLVRDADGARDQNEQK